MNRTALLQRLQNVYQRLVLGDPALTRKVADWKRLAKAGNPKAKVIYNSLAVLHWRRQDTMAFAHAEVFYNRLRAYDRQAHAELRQLVSRKQAGDPKAKALFATLKAVHHKRKASLWSNGPGAPQTGYHPMPSYHRVGIDIPGTMNQLGQLGQQWLGNAYPQQPQMYLPLTPQAVAMLVQLIQQVLAGMRGGGGLMMDRSVRPMEDAPSGDGLQSLMAESSQALKNVFSTTPRPATQTVIPKAVVTSTAPLTSSQLTMRTRNILSQLQNPHGLR